MDEVRETRQLLYKFSESERVLALIRSLPSYSTLTQWERCLDNFKWIIDQYQEQPHLLDGSLSELMSAFIEAIAEFERRGEVELASSEMAHKSSELNPKKWKNSVHNVYKLLFIVAKTRQFKVLVRRFPHEVADLPLVCSRLEAQSPTDARTFETRIVLLLWLTGVCMIPFDLERFDGKSTSSTGQGDGSADDQSMMNRIYKLALLYLDSSDRCMDVAAYLLARFLSRKDVKLVKLAEFLRYAIRTIAETDLQHGSYLESSWRKWYGVLRAVGLIFKHCPRNDLLPLADECLSAIIGKNVDAVPSQTASIALRLVGMKSVQRIGLVFLENRVPKWRYDRGKRSLEESLGVAQGDNNSSSVHSTGPNEMDHDAGKNSGSGDVDADDDEIDVPDQLEEIIDYTLKHLYDEDTRVRFSAAKGIGRISSRLTKEMAGQVVSSVLELMTPRQSDVAWHGACIALAELGRRGLLLPSNLGDIVPKLERSLIYDERRAHFSIGVHVRDAACYLCWAFARAFRPQHVQPYVDSLAKALFNLSCFPSRSINCMLFDREVRVRRAASAAFQENVGRQGYFAHGIDIFTPVKIKLGCNSRRPTSGADYFAVGQIRCCYLELSCFVASFAPYRTSLIDHLVDEKLGHWDEEIRPLAASALNQLLVVVGPDHLLLRLLNTDQSSGNESIIDRCLSIDVNTRHGCILACAKIVDGLLKRFGEGASLTPSIIPWSDFERLADVPMVLRERGFMRGVHGDLMRLSACQLIGSLARCSQDLPKSFANDKDKNAINNYMEIIMECLQGTSDEVQLAAGNALENLLTMAKRQQDVALSEGLIERILEQLTGVLHRASFPYVRVGVMRGLAAFPSSAIEQHWSKIWEAVRFSSLSEPAVVRSWYESRCEALKCALTVLDKCPVLVPSTAASFMDLIVTALQDYTEDNRGDIGRFVREQAMLFFPPLLKLVINDEKTTVEPFRAQLLTIVQNILKQSAEKIARARQTAIETIVDVIDLLEPDDLADLSQLRKIFLSKQVKRLQRQFIHERETFPVVAKALHLSVYRSAVLAGFLTSAGDLTASLVRHAVSALDDEYFTVVVEMAKSSDTIVPETVDTMVEVVGNLLGTKRLCLNVLRALDCLLTSSRLLELLEMAGEAAVVELVGLLRNNLAQNRDVAKLIAVAAVYADLLQLKMMEKVRNLCLRQLMILLGHNYPRVRTVSASKLYEAFLAYDVTELCGNADSDEVNMILADTEWITISMAEARRIRNELCQLLGIEPPSTANASSKNT